MATPTLRVLVGLALLSVAVGGCKGAPRDTLRDAPRCQSSAQCVPDPSVGEPKKCVIASEGSAEDAKTPFDLGFTCACLDGACVLAAPPSARVLTSALEPAP